MATQAQVMDIAHESWERKRQLRNDLDRAASDLIVNIYTEYATFRSCTKEAAYVEAKDQLRKILSSVEESAHVALFREMKG